MTLVVLAGCAEAAPRSAPAAKKGGPPTGSGIGVQLRSDAGDAPPDEPGIDVDPADVTCDETITALGASGVPKRRTFSAMTPAEASLFCAWSREVYGPDGVVTGACGDGATVHFSIEPDCETGVLEVEGCESPMCLWEQCIADIARDPCGGDSTDACLLAFECQAR